jgi:hypothetical protein
MQMLLYKLAKRAAFCCIFPGWQKIDKTVLLFSSDQDMKN